MSIMVSNSPRPGRQPLDFTQSKNNSESVGSASPSLPVMSRHSYSHSARSSSSSQDSCGSKELAATRTQPSWADPLGVPSTATTLAVDAVTDAANASDGLVSRHVVPTMARNLMKYPNRYMNEN